MPKQFRSTFEDYKLVSKLKNKFLLKISEELKNYLQGDSAMIPIS